MTVKPIMLSVLIRISEPKMFEAVKHTLMRSLRQVVLTQEFVRSKGVEV